MTASFARASARGSQRVLTATAMQWEKQGPTALGTGDWWATKSALVLHCGERGTGADQVGGEFSQLGQGTMARDSWRYPLWHSVFSYDFKGVRRAIGGVPGTKQNGTLFGVNRPISSHFVPSIFIYLERVKHGWRSEARNAGGESLHRGESGRNRQVAPESGTMTNRGAGAFASWKSADGSLTTGATRRSSGGRGAGSIENSPEFRLRARPLNRQVDRTSAFP